MNTSSILTISFRISCGSLNSVTNLHNLPLNGWALITIIGGVFKPSPTGIEFGEKSSSSSSLLGSFPSICKTAFDLNLFLNHFSRFSYIDQYNLA